MTHQEYDPCDVEGNELRIEQRRSADELAQQNRDEDLVWLMKGPRGRRIVRRLIDESGARAATPVQNALALGYAEGKRAVGYELLATIERLCPEEYATMNLEQKNDRAGSR